MTLKVLMHIYRYIHVDIYIYIYTIIQCVCVRLRDFVFIPPIIKLGGGILESGCPSVRSANKLGMIVHHHDLLCHANRLGFFKVKVTVGAQIIKKITVSSISPESFATKLGIVLHNDEPESCDKFGLQSLWSRSQ